MENNCEEVHVCWAPIADVPDRLLLDCIIDGRDGLKIYLAEDLSSCKRLVIDFDLACLMGYKVANDSYTWRSDSSRRREKSCSLNLVEGSTYLKWFEDETYGTTDLSQARHYCFLLSEEVIDVAALGNPKVYYCSLEQLPLVDRS